MGCCLSQRIQDVEKDEPLLQEHEHLVCMKAVHGGGTLTE